MREISECLGVFALAVRGRGAETQIAQMSFDPSCLGLAPSFGVVSIETPISCRTDVKSIPAQTKKQRVDPPECWVPSAFAPPPSAARAASDSSGVPSTLPVFSLPLPEIPTPSPYDPFAPGSHGEAEATNALVDSRRAKFKTDKKFPLAGILREDGGIFAWMDAQKKNKKQ